MVDNTEFLRVFFTGNDVKLGINLGSNRSTTKDVCNKSVVVELITHEISSKIEEHSLFCTVEMNGLMPTASSQKLTGLVPSAINRPKETISKIFKSLL